MPIPDSRFFMHRFNGPDHSLFNGYDQIMKLHIAILGFSMSRDFGITKSRSPMPLLTLHMVWHVLDPATCHSDSWLACASSVKSAWHLSFPGCATCPWVTWSTDVSWINGLDHMLIWRFRFSRDFAFCSLHYEIPIPESPMKPPGCHASIWMSGPDPCLI